MFDSIFEHIFDKFPLIEGVLAVLLGIAGIMVILRGEKQKRARAAAELVETDNRNITTLDLLRFEAELDEHLAEKRRDLYARIEVLSTRVTVLETQLSIMMSKKRP